MAHFYPHQTHPAPAPARNPHRGSRVSLHPRAGPSPTPGHHHAPARQHTTPVLDPILTHHTNRFHPPMEYDVSLPLSQILVSQGTWRSESSYSGLTPRHLSPPAVYPPRPFMRIKCEYLQWPIDIDAQPGSDGVTVGDVLKAIDRGLRRRVSAAEWHAASNETQDHVRNAYFRRCKRQQSHRARAYEESQGLRRVDWLMKNTLFLGLTPGKSRDRWVMHLRPTEKTVKFALGS